jgi:hypothetical protein
MTGTQFFSNKVDSGNIFTKYPSTNENHNYKWNGTNMSYADHGSVADGSLTLMDVSNQTTNFTIKVIDAASGDSKVTFNTAYKNALSAYADSDGCPATAKPWLESIIGQIPTT